MIKYYDIRLERKILAIILQSDDVVSDVINREDIGKGLFSDISNQIIFEASIDYFRINSVVPDASVFKSFVVKYIDADKRSKIAKSNLIERYAVIIERLYSIKIDGGDYDRFDSVIEELTILKKGREIQKTIIELSDKLDDGDVEIAEKKLIDFRIDVLSDASVSDGGVFTNDWKERVRLVKEKKENPDKFLAVPIGITGWNPDNPFKDDLKVRMDKFLSGGFYKGELNLVIGDSGAGKSMELMEFAYYAALSKKNVAYFSIEMSKWKIETRLDSRISGVPYEKFRMATINKKDYNRWKSSIKRFDDKCGVIYVEGFYKGCTIEAIEMKAKEIEQKIGDKLDLIVIDYLNDISPLRPTGDKWIDQGQVSWAMKMLASSWNKGAGIPVVTANQGKSSSSLSKFKVLNDGMVFFKRMKWNDAAFSPLPSQHASVIIGLLYSPVHDNMLASVVNHQIIKNRDGETSLGIVTFPNFNVCKMNATYKYNVAKEKYGEGELSKNNEVDEEVF